MRIAYIINSVEGGGAALPVPALCGVLRAQGAEVVVLALTRRDGRALRSMQAAGLEVRVRDGGRRDHLAALRWLDREVRAIGATHLWTSLSRATLLGQIVGQRQQLPVASWQHAAWLKPANLRLLKLRWRASAIWVADSDAVWRYARDIMGVDEARLMLWPIFRADAAAPQAAPWRPGEPMRIGSLGRLHRVKGYDVLADALATGIDARVTIGGDGDAGAELGDRSGGRLDFAGFVGDPRAFLAGLNLYLQPSRSEGFCLAAHEAMQAGLPVIASAVGEIARSVLPGETGWLVPPGDAIALAAALRAALAQPERLAAMGAAGRARLLSRFGPERFVAAGAAIVARLRETRG
ncbi:glycosyltransferase family 4 protein [Sphingomonas nostoxanthinifaciens]|uniref:glycosyltransferase family 4 protein n=1 Tax=Sphingomonas nostoxanthinifaciens TaxID=2872652 RepID=UPI001CC1F226|nr:glycosyltransferase family 4 protein [Sphingomonas nostoxanthinifaciens]UAK26087.1 glycosyltransferase family 4 protein [Sphingomonas nostoxanthinifaciens]